MSAYNHLQPAQFGPPPGQQQQQQPPPPPRPSAGDVIKLVSKLAPEAAEAAA